jgi:hypothetical protein
LLGTEVGGLHHLDDNRLFDFCLMIGEFWGGESSGLWQGMKLIVRQSVIRTMSVLRCSVAS